MPKPKTEDPQVQDPQGEELTEGERRALVEDGRKRTVQNRLDAIEAIAGNSEEGRMDRDGDMKDTDEVEEAQAKSNADMDTGEESEELELEVVEEKKPAKEEDPLIELKVMGQVKKYPKSQVEEHGGVKAFQMELAADWKLKEADRRLKEAEEREKLIEAKQPPAQQTTEEGAEEHKEAPEEDAIAIDFDKVVEAIQYGDPEEAKDALKDMMSALNKGRVKTQTLTKEDMLAIVKEEREAEDRRNQAEEAKTIIETLQLPVDEGGYQDIVSDPFLRNEAALVVERLKSEGKPNDLETYQTACEEIRTKRAEALGIIRPPSPKITDIETRKERKKGKDAITGANVRQRTETTQEAKSEEEARSEAISEIRKARGQSA